MPMISSRFPSTPAFTATVPSTGIKMIATTSNTTFFVIELSFVFMLKPPQNMIITVSPQRKI